MVKIYIAGPDVFELDSIEIGRKYKELCKIYGFIGLYPLDNEISFDNKPQIIAQNIYAANIELIHQADIVIANLNSFRGKEADSGTIWECGYAKALNKKVYGYMSETKPYIDSFKKEEKIAVENREFTDLENSIIENFDYPINLMIACSVEDIIEGSFEEVLKVIRD